MRISMLPLLLLTAFSGCGDRLGSNLKLNPQNPNSAQNTDLEQKPKQENVILTEPEEYYKLPEEVRIKYQAPPKELKVGEHVLIIGKLNFSNLVFTGSEKGVRIQGELRLNDVEGFSRDDVFKFDISGEDLDRDREIAIRAIDVDRRTDSKVRLGAIVTCGVVEKSNDQYEVDCSEAKIDFLVQVKQQKFKQQYRTQKPSSGQTSTELTLSGESENTNQEDLPEVTQPTTPLTPPVDPGAQPTPTPGAPNTPTTPAAPVAPATPTSPATPTAPSAPPAAANPDSGAQQGNNEPIGEGDDESINGAFQTHVDSKEALDEIFGEEKPAAEQANGQTPGKPAQPGSPTSPSPTPTPNQPPTTGDAKSGNSGQAQAKKPVIKNGIQINPDGTIRPVDQAINFPDNGRLRNATDLLLQQRQLKQDQYYIIAHPDRAKYFATYEMAQVIFELGKFKSSTFNKKLSVSNISLKNGGFSKPHRSHQNGTDGDFGYPTDDETLFPRVAIEEPILENGEPKRDSRGNILRRTVSFNPKAYSAEKTLALLEAAFKQTHAPIDRIFMNQKIIDHLCTTAKQKGLIDFGSRNPETIQKTQFWKNIFATLQHVDGHGDHMHIRIKCTRSHRDCQEKRYLLVNHCQS